MKTLFTLSLILSFGYYANAQEEMDVVIEGKVHTVTVGEEYKYVNSKGDTITYFVTGDEKTGTPAKTTTTETETKTITTEETKAKETTQPANKIEKLPIGQAKKREETETKGLLGKAYRFDDMAFGEKELLTTEKLSLKKIANPLDTDYPSLEFVDKSNVAFCYNQEVKVYHGDYQEYDEVTKTVKVCQDGRWSENNNDLQMSLVLDNKQKRLAYHIDGLNSGSLVMQKKDTKSAIF